MWRRVRGHGMLMAMALVAVLALIGIGSFLFHTHAQGWAAVADITPILAFILIYLFAVNRDVWELHPLFALVLTALFIPYAALTIPMFQWMHILGGSAAYAPLPPLILIYAILLRRKVPDTARGLAIGAAILIVSITFRVMDEPFCVRLPMGTHFMWHILNAIMLGWMIEVYRRAIVSKSVRLSTA